MAKAAIISAVPPLMVKTPANPLGLPKSVFDDLQAQLFANRAKFYYDLPAGPFYGFNRPGVKTIEPNVWNWWRQGMMGGAKAHYDGIVAFSQTDFTEDLRRSRCRFWSSIARTTDRALSGCRSIVSQASQERHAEDQGLPARHDHDASRRYQCRPARVHQELTPRNTIAMKGESPVVIIRNAAATAKINVTKLRSNVSVLEGSGGNIVVLTGRDGRSFSMLE